jgi:cell wall-associated NlpC family hydrolase
MFFLSISILVIAFLSVQPVFAGSYATLKAGMRGDSVIKLQKNLKTLGFMSISPTGYFGDLTKAAVVRFQKKYSLTPDGIAGAKTQGKIETLLNRTTMAARSDSESISQKIISFAKRFLGVDYVWGGSSPDGFDCSGFTKYVFGKYDIALNRTAADQAKQGSAVGKGSLQLGDLVFFDTNGGHNRINHVGIYIGGGRFIHASSGSSNVVISPVTEGFYSKTYMTARRVIK